MKLLGDGALLLFPDADPCAAAVRAAVAIRDELRAHDLHPHTGIDHGPVVERDGDIFGRTVNLAARLASLATAGQIVVSEAWRGLGDRAQAARDAGARVRAIRSWRPSARCPSRASTDPCVRSGIS